MLLKRKRVVIFDTLGEYPATVTFTRPPDLYRFLLANEKTHFVAAYRPDDPEKEFFWVSRIIESIGNICFVAEEVDFFISPQKLDPAFSRLIRYGRHRGVEMICISRRPAEVNRNLTAQASRLFIFRMHEPRDIAYFRTLIGPVAEKIPSLPDFTPLEYSV